jgi:hypothetical protein
MKKVILSIAVFAGILLFNSARAQVGVKINIGTQPVWGPVGYDYVDYYYLPDAEVYYSVPQRVYIYEERGTWVRTSALPVRFGTIDLYHTYKVVINEPKPYLRHNAYKVKYVQYKGKRDQIVIRDSREQKYFVVKGHPEHSNWKNSSNSGGRVVQHKGNKVASPSQQNHNQQKGAGHSKGGGKHKK